MTPARRIFEELPGEITNPPLWPEAKESTFQSPDDPALIIDESKRDLLQELADNYHYEQQ